MKVDLIRGLVIDSLLDAREPGLSKLDRRTPCAYREELEQKSIEELMALHEPVRRSFEHRAAEDQRVAEKLKFSNLAVCWARKPYWEKHEAVALLVEQDPLDCISHGRTGAYLSVPSSVTAQAKELDDLIGRAIAVKVLPKRLPPDVLLCWLNNKGVTVPNELMNAVEPIGAPAIASAPLRLAVGDIENGTESLKTGGSSSLKVSAATLDKLERARQPDVAPLVDGNPMKPPALWSRGLKLIAWKVAGSLVKEGYKISGPALWEGMAKSQELTVRDGTLRSKSSDAKLSGGESEVKSSTVQKGWRKELADIFSG